MNLSQERDRLIADLKKTQESEFLHLQQYTEKYNFVIVRTSSGFVLAPAVEGKPIPPEELANLTARTEGEIRRIRTAIGW